MSNKDDFSQDFLESLRKNGSIIVFEDGFARFVVKDCGGLSAEELRAIADELDRQNRSLTEDINSYFSDLDRNK